MYEVYKSNKEDEALFLLRNKLSRDEAFSVLNELSNNKDKCYLIEEWRTVGRTKPPKHLSKSMQKFYTEPIRSCTLVAAACRFGEVTIYN